MAGIPRNLLIAGIVVLIILVIGAIFIATRPPQPTPTPTPVTVKLKVIGPWAGAEAEYFKKVLEEYKRVKPNVEFEYSTVRAED